MNENDLFRQLLMSRYSSFIAVSRNSKTISIFFFFFFFYGYTVHLFLIASHVIDRHVGMEQMDSPGRTRTRARRCSWHPPTGSGSSRSDTFPRESKPLWTESLASLSRASPNAGRRSVRTKTKSIWETASTTYPHDKEKKSFRKRKRSSGRKATQSPPKQCVK